MYRNFSLFAGHKTISALMCVVGIWRNSDDLIPGRFKHKRSKYEYQALRLLVCTCSLLIADTLAFLAVAARALETFAPLWGMSS
jgi:hypothetical protein